MTTIRPDHSGLSPFRPTRAAKQKQLYDEIHAGWVYFWAKHGVHAETKREIMNKAKRHDSA